MVKNSFTCGNCNKTYLKEEEAIACEKKHEEEKKEQEKQIEENKKMIFGNRVKINKSCFDELGGCLDFKLPKDCDLIILMGNKGGGYVPYQCLLPHQVYMKDIKETFKEKGFEVIYVVGIKSNDAFPVAYKDKYGFNRWKESDDALCESSEVKK